MASDEAKEASDLSQSQPNVETAINEDEFDIHVVAYRSFQQIFVPQGLAKLEKILNDWVDECEMEARERLIKSLERRPSGRILDIQDSSYMRLSVW